MGSENLSATSFDLSMKTSGIYNEKPLAINVANIINIEKKF
jgi:hypothetical protein